PREWPSPRHSPAESAGKIADFLAGRPEIARLIYPGRSDHPQADVVKKQMSGGSTLTAVIGASAIDHDGALLDFDFREVKVAQAIIANARHVILV
ncbi:hypothetical protein EN790_34430, partial [Mesorhizobium sp. M2D.F.Ca.ET.147.01.1.1]|uniref:PLP-dependent transferase n=1 Tax=Mesorhizobium sp. M2D.F.Ca.ET.147.01.1.1 TaxID=2563934 RepID=UPI00113925CE